jgi:hypothetical protein
MTKKDLAIEYIRHVHANQRGSLEDVLEELDELAELVEELSEAIRQDILGNTGD